MPTCMYCGRDDLPRLPMMPYRADVVTAHAKSKGEPCGQGGTGALPDDYPRDELVADDGWWDLASAPVAMPEPDDGAPTIGSKPARKRARKTKPHLKVVT